MSRMISLGQNTVIPSGVDVECNDYDALCIVIQGNAGGGTYSISFGMGDTVYLVAAGVAVAAGTNNVVYLTRQSAAFGSVIPAAAMNLGFLPQSVRVAVTAPATIGALVAYLDD